MRPLLIFLLIPFICQAQYKRADIFNEKIPMTWLGIDFSRLRVDGYNYGNSQFKEVFFYDWNEMVRTKEKPVPVHKYLHRESVKISIDQTNRINSSITRNLRSGSSLERDSIIASLRNYDFKGLEGIGVILFAGEIIHKGEHFHGKVAFVDMKTGELLLLKKIKGNGKGFGMTNTWKNAIKYSLIYMKRRWAKWEEQITEADKAVQS